MANDKAINALIIYCKRLEELYALYSEAAIGMRMLSDWVSQVTNDPKTDCTLASRAFYGALGTDPNDDGSKYVHLSTLGESATRCANGGQNRIILARSIIVVAYSLWEHETRKILEDSLGLPRNNIQSPVFGDLNKYRQAIVHVGGRLDKATEIFKFIEVGEGVVLTSDQLVTLLETLFEEVKRLSFELCGFDINYEFIKRGIIAGHWTESAPNLFVRSGVST